MTQPFTINDFTTDDWRDFPEYETCSIDWDHIVDLHKSEGGLLDQGKCGNTDLWFFLHMKGEFSFVFYVYDVNTCRVSTVNTSRGNIKNLTAEPVIWIYGTTFDGVRECAGGQNYSAGLLEVSNSLKWIHEYACYRWPRFKDWYKNSSL